MRKLILALVAMLGLLGPATAQFGGWPEQGGFNPAEAQWRQWRGAYERLTEQRVLPEQYPARARLSQRIQYCLAFGRAFDSWSPRPNLVCQGRCVGLNQVWLNEWISISRNEFTAYAGTVGQLQTAVEQANRPQAVGLAQQLVPHSINLRRRFGGLLQVTAADPRARLIIQPEVGVAINCLADLIEAQAIMAAHLIGQIPR